MDPANAPSRTLQEVCAYWLMSRDGSSACARGLHARSIVIRMPGATRCRPRIFQRWRAGWRPAVKPSVVQAALCRYGTVVCGTSDAKSGATLVRGAGAARRTHLPVLTGLTRPGARAMVTEIVAIGRH